MSKLVRGQVREDGMVFLRYHPNFKDGEYWSTIYQLKKEQEKDKLRSSKRYLENPKRYSDSRLKWGINNPEKRKRVNKNSKLKCLYGISIEKYEEILKFQNGVCAICQNKCLVKEALSVDHCHKTKVVRGLLCHSCNAALGQMKDSPELLRKSANYVEKFQIIRN